MTDDGLLIIVFVLVWLLVAVAGYVWYAWALSLLFKRLGTDGWRGWVPILNEMTILERGGVPAWNVVFYFIPIVQLYGLYLKFTAVDRIGKHFGRGTGMAVLGALVTPVWATILVLARTPATAAAPQPSPQSASHRQVAGGMAAGQGARVNPQPHQVTPAAPQASRPAPVAPQPTQPTPLAPLTTPAPPAPEAPVPSQFTPPAPMPEPAQPDSPPAGPSVDSGPIVVHNPWARPVTSPPAADAASEPPAPVPAQTPPWLTGSPNASAAHDEVQSVPEDDDDDGETVVVDRRPKVEWHLNVDGGAPLPLKAETVILGRRPSITEPETHALAVPDSTRTLSKAHARLKLVDGEWFIADLNSTNGVLIVDDSGNETLISPGESVPVPGEFILGKLRMHISFEKAGT